ncbi:leucine-rich repeat-containing protein 41 [Anolis carolinensis]|uniref:Leucine-rich repeat-containing protein 41 n=1 Tax=Anolis carolinensis TaxID=28377 RepID=G1KAH4_ANOCA|nr:PREDICTED: leucine-rich repeat-containing protein 41 [Anolis carolinensis]|eukprot:XP_003220322.1 PREDICTED: leucine-rich repeat-containing protein 41 [Anolis carolinensis]
MEAESEEEVAAASEQRPLSLFQLSGKRVSSIMGRVEKEVWALPGPILQGILPLLNIYYLERIEATAVKKGLSTQPIWCKLWFEIIKTRPSRLENIKCWRRKFLETFFSNVLRGILDVSSHQRLNDPSFLPLLYTSRHVTQLTIYNMLESVSELMAKHNQDVLESLAVSLRSLTFHHLLSSSLSTRHQLSLFLHRLIHHGVVNHLSMSSWPDPDPVLLALVLKMSAGIWHPGKKPMNQENLCHLCREKSAKQRQALDQELMLSQDSDKLLHSSADQCSDNDLRNEDMLSLVSQESVAEFGSHDSLARTSSENLQDPPNFKLDSSSCQSTAQYSTCSGSCNAENLSTFQHGSPSGRVQKQHKTATTKGCHQKSGKMTEGSEDLYDFVFAVAREEQERGLYSKRRKTEEWKTPANSSPFSAEVASGSSMDWAEGGQPLVIPSLRTAGHFRSVSTLEVFSIPLTRNMCQMLGNLLSSWVSLEKLVLTLNGLGPGILSILSGLRTLSQHSGYSLRVVCISDMFSYVPCMNLVHSFLSAVPLLQTLLVGFDLKTTAEWSKLEENLGSLSLQEAIPESQLEHLEIRFPREPLQTGLLVPVLKSSRSLQSLSLDSVSISCPQEVELLLCALKECSPGLKRLSFHDINLSGHSKEVLLLLQDPVLQEITFSFCRLFENCTAEFLSEMINVVKKNTSLKSLKLPGNRLGNHRLVALADIFSEDSSSSICHLDVSSNCIKPDGLLEFAKKLESYLTQCREQIKFMKLCLYQNWLDQDAATAQDAIRRLKAMCSVVSDTWDSSQAFADYISVM